MFETWRKVDYKTFNLSKITWFKISSSCKSMMKCEFKIGQDFKMIICIFSKGVWNLMHLYTATLCISRMTVCIKCLKIFVSSNSHSRVFSFKVILVKVKVCFGGAYHIT